jgi:hypothetical protein
LLKKMSVDDWTNDGEKGEGHQGGGKVEEIPRVSFSPALTSVAEHTNRKEKDVSTPSFRRTYINGIIWVKK